MYRGYSEYEEGGHGDQGADGDSATIKRAVDFTSMFSVAGGAMTFECTTLLMGPDVRGECCETGGLLGRSLHIESEAAFAALDSVLVFPDGVWRPSEIKGTAAWAEDEAGPRRLGILGRIIDMGESR